MRTVWLLVVAILIAGLAPVCAAEEAKTDIPLYDGKPGTKIGDVCVNLKDGAEMVWVPAGEFTMGSTNKQTAAVLREWTHDLKDYQFVLDAEKPQRKVYLDGYWMYKCEVTVAQYRKFCEATERKMPDAPSWGWKEDHPMVMVIWQDSADYAKWSGVSLPTDAQWEKAARGTDGRIYPWGNSWDLNKCITYPDGGSTDPVGSHPEGTSPYGCMDMAGNVQEWCADWYDPNYYKNAPTRNPKGPSRAAKFTMMPTGHAGEGSGARVSRGGSWDYGSYDSFRCASRNYSASTGRSHARGFRCAKTP